MYQDILSKFYELIQNKEKFVMATVVFTKGMTSSKPGYKALITYDGNIYGWIGGGCIEESIKELAIECMKKGITKMVKIQPIGEELREEGVEIVTNACVSSGTIYVYLEPYNVKTSLIVIGDTPIANFLIKLANLFDFYTIHIGKEINKEAHENINYDDLDKVMMPNDAFVVIATSMSSSNITEQKLVEFFLNKQISYLGVVASKRRASALKNYLIKKGYSKELISKIRSPAGISLGSSLNYKEIALSIITEIIGIKKGGNFMPIREIEEIRIEENFVDPVCGMFVSKDTYKLIYENIEYRFCSEICLERFKENPIKFLKKMK
jgi:xanthine dehydrogenase accessory factor